MVHITKSKSFLAFGYIFLLYGCGNALDKKQSTSEDTKNIKELSEQAKILQKEQELKDSLDFIEEKRKNEELERLVLEAERLAEEERIREEIRRTEELACDCKPKTFRKVSKHSWVEFRMPKGNKNDQIKVKKGAYNRLNFFKCYRVFWTNLTFKCNPSYCTWEPIVGRWDADGTCEITPLSNGPYVYTGDRNL